MKFSESVFMAYEKLAKSTWMGFMGHENAHKVPKMGFVGHENWWEHFSWAMQGSRLMVAN